MAIDIYLASQSPRRSELLKQVGISFSVVSINIDETPIDSEDSKEYVVRLAKEKALAGWNAEKSLNKPVLGADTAVVIDGEILGKPQNNEDAKNMLNLLSARTHQVMTAVVLAVSSKSSSQPELREVISVSEVSFKRLSEQEIEEYVESGECHDKAGSYGIQGLAAAFITHLSGSYSGVMGLPLYETVELLKNASIREDSLVVS